MMDLAAALTNLQHGRTVGDVQIAVAKKMLDVQRADGAVALQLLQAAGKTADSAGDALVAAATGLGGQIDAYG